MKLETILLNKMRGQVMAASVIAMASTAPIVMAQNTDRHLAETPSCQEVPAKSAPVAEIEKLWNAWLDDYLGADRDKAQKAYYSLLLVGKRLLPLLAARSKSLGNTEQDKIAKQKLTKLMEELQRPRKPCPTCGAWLIFFIPSARVV